MLKVVLFDSTTDGHHLEYAEHIARYLRGQGDEVTFVTSREPDGGTGRSAGDGFDHVVFLDAVAARKWTGPAPSLFRNFWRIRRCLSFATEWRADVVHFLYLDRNELPLLGALLRRDPKRAVFATLFWPYFVSEARETLPAAKRAFRAANRRALRFMLERDRLDALFVHSERTRSMILTGGSLSLAERVAVVPDPTVEPPAMTVDHARAALGLPDGPIILFFGETRADKGASTLLGCLPHLEGTWTVVMAGKAEAVGKAEADACRGILRDAQHLVTRFDYIPEDDADRYFRAADVVVLPYTDRFKGTSGVQRRAAASGKPVVATDVGDVGPTVREAELGIVVPPDSPEQLAAGLQAFLARREEIQREVEPRALAFAEAHSWRHLGRRTRDRYLSVLERPEAPRP